MSESKPAQPTPGGFCCGLLMLPIALALLVAAFALFYMVLH